MLELLLIFPCFVLAQFLFYKIDKGKTLNAQALASMSAGVVCLWAFTAMHNYELIINAALFGLSCGFLIHREMKNRQTGRNRYYGK
jgi:hypothetical protein